jgi:hypothetical protein
MNTTTGIAIPLLLRHSLGFGMKSINANKKSQRKNCAAVAGENKF